MSGTDQKYERIIRYLKDLLSNRERHDLEKDMMQDAFEEEAFEGLNQIAGEELETDMEGLRNRLKEQVKPVRKLSLGLFYRMAAGIMLLVAIAGILYLVFRIPSQNLITEESGKAARKAPPEMMTMPEPDALIRKEAASAIPAEAEPGVKQELNEQTEPIEIPQVITEQPLQAEEEVAVDITVQAAENVSKIIAEEKAAREVLEVQEERAADAKSVSGEFREPSLSKKKSEKAAQAVIDKSMTADTKTRVVDMEGNPLPGVTIIEKGTTRGTVTDMDGMFFLQVFDPGSVLSLSYVGFVSEEVNMKDIAGKDIPMTEDLVALDEVVVVGYGVQKKSDESYVVTMQMADEISPGGNADVSNFVNPVPPGGSAKAFKQWVNERLDVSVLNAYTGKQKILVSITVQADGSVGDIRIREAVPDSLAREFRRVISQSPRWTPALKDELPVVAKVALRFAVWEE